MDETTKQPSLYQAFWLAKRERDAFLYIDVLAASTGLLAPLAFGLIYPGTQFLVEASKLLDSAGIYIFAIALLAASSSFIFLDKDNKYLNEARDDYDRTAGLKAAAMIAVGMFLSGLQFASTSPHEETRSIESRTASITKDAPILKGKIQPAVGSHGQQTNEQPSLHFGYQFVYLIVSLWLSLRLFCLKNIGSIPGESERIETIRAREIKELLESAQKEDNFFLPEGASK